MANDNNKKKYIKYEDTTYILEDHRLPDPTSDDNGKVLGVVNGEYALKQEEGGGGGAVTSVNGKTGAVVLGASDVHALPDSTVIPSAPLEIPVTESDGAYSTTVTAAQIRAAKDNSVFVFLGGEARIKALLWLPWDEDVDLLIGIETFGRTIMSVAANVSNNSVSIRVKQTVIPTDTSDLTNGAGFITMDDVPAAVTEQTVSGWGFTKNTGTYSKPSGGIPKSDLAQAVQTSLGKADSALQQHQSLSDYQTKAITDTGNYFTTDTVEGALQEIGTELSGINTLIGSGVIS